MKFECEKWENPFKKKQKQIRKILVIGCKWSTSLIELCVRFFKKPKTKIPKSCKTLLNKIHRKLS